MKTEELNIDTLVSCFPKEQIEKAMESITHESPLYYALKMIEAMTDFILYNESIDEVTRKEYLVLRNHLEIHLSLIKQFYNIDCKNYENE